MKPDLQSIHAIADILGIVATIILTLLAIKLSKQFNRISNRDSITAKTISCLTNLLDEYKKAMNLLSEAYLQSQELLDFMLKGIKNNNLSEFNKEYYLEKYQSFRQVHYFFELLGSLMKQNEIEKETFWQYFTFPIEYFQKTRDLRMLITDKKCLPSYAESFCWLFVYYNEWRKKHKIEWYINGEGVEFNDYKASDLVGKNYKEYKEQCEKIFNK